MAVSLVQSLSCPWLCVTDRPPLTVLEKLLVEVADVHVC